MSATWGVTQEGLTAKLHAAETKVIDLQYLRKKKAEGVVLTRDEVKALRNLDALEQDLRRLKTSPVGFVDVREQLQRRVEKLGSLPS